MPYTDRQINKTYPRGVLSRSIGEGHDIIKSKRLIFGFGNVKSPHPFPKEQR